jgi:surface antigen
MSKKTSAARAGGWLVAAVMAVGAGSALAQNLGFMRDSAMSFMNRDDVAMILKNYTLALDTLPDGHTTTWTNPKSGHSGTASPMKSFKEKGMDCRSLEMSNTAGGQTGRSELVFCKTSAGWKAVR